MTARASIEIEDKMAEYAKRLRELVLEAYAEGILLGLTASGTPTGPLQPNQSMRRVSAPIPGTTHSHPVLRKPMTATAEAVTEAVQVLVLPDVIDNKPWPIIPVHINRAAPCFVAVDEIRPWQARDGEHMTSALKFGRKVDLLSLSNYDAHLANGSITEKDIVGSSVVLDKIFFLRDGQLMEEFVQHLRGSAFYFKIGADKRYLQISFDLRMKDRHACIGIIGDLDRETGVLELRALSSDTAIVPLGYTLNATRIKRPQ